MMAQGWWRHPAVGAAVAVAALFALVALGPAGSAGAADTTDQITGAGDTDSAVTVSWAQGLVGTDNKTAVSPRDSSGPLSFMSADFQNLKVTVSQTESLVHQSVNVTWAGGKPTIGQFQGDFLQMMECYGDAASGPSPEGCEYGSSGLLGTGSSANPGIGSRGGSVCLPDSTPSPTTPPGGIGAGAFQGCDTAEPGSPLHTDPTSGDPSSYSVPFIPYDDPSTKVYGQSTNFYDQFNSNEVQEAKTGVDGTGQQFFQTLTSAEAPGLGCGQLEPSGAVRDCWLVIVPRGEYEPNGFKIQGDTGAAAFMQESPLGASTWAQRIQIHLGYDPISPPCALGSVQPRQALGTEVIAHAVFSWQLALNAAGKCKTFYSYTATPESQATNQLVNDSADYGLAFTTVPIGSEAVRAGKDAPTVPAMVYAPVGVSAMTFAFNINNRAGYVSTPVKLTPRLVAKALTQSYLSDLVGYLPNDPVHGSVPTWASGNPIAITDDPEFTRLNPGVTTPPSGSPLAPLLTEDHSGVNQQVWNWIQSDPAARAWLDGTPDENGMKINPAYQAQDLGTTPTVDGYPRADPTCFFVPGQVGEPEQGRCAQDLLPYINNFDDGSTRVRAASNPEGAAWDPSKIAPDGSTGWWGDGGIEPAGQVLMWTIADSADLANYGLVPATLCNGSGTNCVGPTSSSISAALAGAKTDSSGLVKVDPGAVAAGSYPLVDVTYAAVPVKQTQAALKDYAAFIDYAAGPGQTAGVGAGQLPHGYLPLPAALRSQANAAATTLLTTASTGPAAPTASHASGSTSASGVEGNATSPHSAQVGIDSRANSSLWPGSAVATPPSSTPGRSESPTNSVVTSEAPATLAAKSTPSAPVGAVRWALIAVVVAGLIGGIGGPLWRSGFLGRVTARLRR